MGPIAKKYVTDENNQRVAVQVDIETFEKMERLLEDYALGKILEEDEHHEYLSAKEAKAFYEKLRNGEE